MLNKNSLLQAVCPARKVAEKSVTKRAIERQKRRLAVSIPSSWAKSGAYDECTTESRIKKGLSTRVVF
ncbi:hypothetical protein EAG21025_28370 [Enterobacter asburiae]